MLNHQEMWKRETPSLYRDCQQPIGPRDYSSNIKLSLVAALLVLMLYKDILDKRRIAYTSYSKKMSSIWDSLQGIYANTHFAS